MEKWGLHRKLYTPALARIKSRKNGGRSGSAEFGLCILSAANYDKWK